jgi:hypothetical protein
MRMPIIGHFIPAMVIAHHEYDVGRLSQSPGGRKQKTENE